MSAQDYTLFSGAAKGAEAAFGAAAERYGVAEINYTFEGHADARTRGKHVMTEAELDQGRVSLAYVGKMMNRVYKDTPAFRKILAGIWHQVNSGHEIFCVGWIKDDGHVKGGTGWGAEFAKLCNKPLYVFDQAEEAWFKWEETAWTPVSEPVITEKHFTGTGTRLLNDAGQAAIDALFVRSFES